VGPNALPDLSSASNNNENVGKCVMVPGSRQQALFLFTFLAIFVSKNAKTKTISQPAGFGGPCCECFCLPVAAPIVRLTHIPSRKIAEALNWMSAPSRGICLLMSRNSNSNQRLVQFVGACCK